MRSPAFTALFVLQLVGCAGPADLESGNSDAPDASDVTANLPSPLTPIAEVASELASHRVQLLELTRVSRGILEVRFALMNTATEGEATDVGRLLAAAPEDAGTVADAFIVEPRMEKKYYVLRDADGRPMGSRDFSLLPPGGRIELWARFPVPAGEAREIDIHIPSAPPFTSLALPPAPP